MAVNDEHSCPGRKAGPVPLLVFETLRNLLRSVRTIGNSDVFLPNQLGRKRIGHPKDIRLGNMTILKQTHHRTFSRSVCIKINGVNPDTCFSLERLEYRCAALPFFRYIDCHLRRLAFLFFIALPDNEQNGDHRQHAENNISCFHFWFPRPLYRSPIVPFFQIHPLLNPPLTKGPYNTLYDCKYYRCIGCCYGRYTSFSAPGNG